MSGGPSYEDRRLSFGAGAEAYARHRPRYPLEAVAWVLKAASGRVRRVVDVGAGTGALTSSLVGLGLEVDAVEPDPGMLAVLREGVPAAAALPGAAEALPLPDACADAVMVAQAWHWMDHGRAAEEFARVVRPGGALGILWNTRPLEPDWLGELNDIIGGEDSARAAVRVRARDDTDAIVLGPRWSTPERGEFRHEVVMTPDSLIALVGTYSYVRLRPDVDEVLAEVRRIAAEHPDLAGRAEFPMPYVTLAYRSTRA